MSDFELHDQDVLADETFDAVHEGAFPGEDPDDDYLQAEAERRWRLHEEQEHEGSACDCPTAEVPISDRAPF